MDRRVGNPILGRGDNDNDPDIDDDFVDVYHGGISGPRRSTMMMVVPPEIHAANVEATRVAQEMGVATSTGGSHNARLLSSTGGSSGGSGRIVPAPPASAPSLGKRIGGLFSRKSLSSSNDPPPYQDHSSSSSSRRRRRQQTPTEQEPLDYQVLPADGRAMGVGLLRMSGPAAAGTSSQPPLAGPFEEAEFVGMSALSDGLMRVGPMHHDDDDGTARVSEPELFDSTGMRAPYREGPYDYHHDEDGRLIKKRWCTSFPVVVLMCCAGRPIIRALVH
jgi:hypothetical protein